MGCPPSSTAAPQSKLVQGMKSEALAVTAKLVISQCFKYSALKCSPNQSNWNLTDGATCLKSKALVKNDYTRDSKFDSVQHRMTMIIMNYNEHILLRPACYTPPSHGREVSLVKRDSLKPSHLHTPKAKHHAVLRTSAVQEQTNLDCLASFSASPSPRTT